MKSVVGIDTGLVTFTHYGQGFCSRRIMALFPHYARVSIHAALTGEV